MVIRVRDERIYMETKKMKTKKQIISDLMAKSAEQENIIESLKISLTEQERIVGEVIDELLILRGGRG